MAEEINFSHAPVMLHEVLEGLDIKSDGAYIDGTLGGAGHSSKIAERLSIKGRLYGFDQDETAIRVSTERLSGFGERICIHRANYREAVSILKSEGVTGVDGILLDLGVSSYQLDTPERGFSYHHDAPLDMRMDQRNPLTAAEVVNTYGEMELFRIIRDYGEDKFAKNIAKHIVRARSEKKIETTFELNEIIKAAIPAKMRVEGGHPSKRTFQAIRIECNKELEVLRDALEEMIDFLNPGGHFAIITFQSLEDRIVKNAFKTAVNPCTCPPSFPVCACGKESKGTLYNNKPIISGEEELKENSRAKSAKLRVFIKK